MSQTSPYAIKDTGGQCFKVDIINKAYSQLRISGLTVQPTPEDLEIALDRLESMAAEWDSRNIKTGYMFEDEPDPNTLAGVKRAYWQAFETNLATRLIPDFNKEAHPMLFKQAASSLSSLSGRVMLERLQEVQYPRRMARGSGNTLRYNRWARFYRNVFSTINQAATISMFIGDINDFVEHFDAYLRDGESIDTYSIQVDSGLKLVSDSNDDFNVYYRIEAESPSNKEADQGAIVTIVITTTEGRVETRQTLFELVAKSENVI